ncbi:hypothetical protein ED733_002007 [Metarhizium rileyi]|uniref:Urease accessory protein UreF n=1 Tax=Metarhizium rileyi (strain RCEF 4871) TaxID=1649241 RepID=A0A5C6G6G1_METRR|nr:hypothetical protein ED733_002007 [Metarhizium rileyi]
MDSKHEIAYSQAAIQNEIADLEHRLAAAKARLRTPPSEVSNKPQPSLQCNASPTRLPRAEASSRRTAPLDSPAHYLLLLSDSQLPIGSFAFSSGLESYVAHNRRATFSSFLPLSLSSYAATTLPFVLAAHRDPSSLIELDDQLDAAVVCTVGRRASVSQGRALLSIWERSFRGTLPGNADLPVLREYSALLKNGNGGSAGEVPPVSAHLPPLFGVVCAVVGLTLQQTAYVYMVGHLKALVSAAVRASMFGPYQAQKVLAGEQAQRLIVDVIEREWETRVEVAGQSVPVMDLWIGRHEVLYSRIFNS